MKATVETPRAHCRLRRRIWRATKRAAQAAAGLLLLSMFGGAIYQYAASRRDLQRYPPPGRMVDVGGFKMHLQTLGQGSPTVVFDNGLFSGSFGWNNVPREVARFTRVCTFDRAGVGWSESSPRARSIDQVNKELHDLLTNAGVEPPYILVGHSLGGIYVQHYVNQYPDEVAGVVLIDSSHPEQTIRSPDDPPPTGLARAVKIVAPFGVVRLFDAIGVDSNASAELLERKALQNTTRHLQASADEVLAIEDNLRALRERPMDLGSKPLVVLTRGTKPEPGDPERFVEAVRAWNEMQSELLRHSTNARQVIAERSGHVIHKDQPELVVDAIRQVFDATRR